MYVAYTLVTELLKLNLFEGQWLLYVPPGIPYVFCVDLGTNSEFCPIHHQVRFKIRTKFC
jgi:hypothetical protein